MSTLMRRLHGRIDGRGRREQEMGYLFSALYTDHAKRVTRNTIGAYREFDNNLKRGKFSP